MRRTAPVGTRPVAVRAAVPWLRAMSAIRAEIAEAYCPRGLQRLFGAGRARQAAAVEIERADVLARRAADEFRQRRQRDAEQQAQLDAELDAMSRSLSGIGE